jgi:NAD(P)-dependent dehydrogenase (short-subunit alcohol dehydrogenase family)
MQETSSESGQPAIGTVLVTGASRGIGLDFVRAWLERGAQVIAGCRTPAGASALGTLMNEYGERLRVMQLDVTDERSVETMAGALGNLNIDLLINNAGILQVETLENMDFASIVEQFKVNALGDAPGHPGASAQPARWRQDHQHHVADGLSR